jgi:hypothetical protein
MLRWAGATSHGGALGKPSREKLVHVKKKKDEIKDEM